MATNRSWSVPPSACFESLNASRRELTSPLVTWDSRIQIPEDSSELLGEYAISVTASAFSGDGSWTYRSHVVCAIANDGNASVNQSAAVFMTYNAAVQRPRDQVSSAARVHNEMA